MAVNGYAAAQDVADLKTSTSALALTMGMRVGTLENSTEAFQATADLALATANGFVDDATAQVAIAAAFAADTTSDAAATAADRVQTGLDRVATGADRVQTGLDRVATGADAISTAADALAASDDAAAAAADAASVLGSAAATAADALATAADALATAADRVQTGLDRVATTAHVASIGDVASFKSNVYALQYGCRYAYATIAEYGADPKTGAVDGDRAVIYNDPNPLNNVIFKRIAGTWVEQNALGLAFNALYVRERLPGNLSLDAIKHKPIWNSGYPNDTVYGGYTIAVDTQSLTNYNPGSTFFKATVNGQNRFEVNNANGLTAMYLGSNNTTFLGMGHNGDGVMTLFSKYDGLGNLGNMAFLGWSGTVGQVVEVSFTGTNRVHLHSAGAFVASSQNGRNEREGYGAARINYIGYEIASATGKTFDFNNSGQSSYPGQIVSISSVVAGQKLLQFCSLSGSTYTEVGNITDTAVANLTGANFKAATPVLSIDPNALGKGTIKFRGNAATSPVDIGLIDCDPNVGNMRFGTTRISYWTEIISNSVVVITAENNGNIGLGLKSYGGGVKVVSQVNCTTAPTTNPTGGIIKYAEAGAGKVRTPGGNTVTYAPNTAIAVTGSRASGAAWASLLAAMVTLGFVTDGTSA